MLDQLRKVSAAPPATDLNNRRGRILTLPPPTRSLYRPTDTERRSASGSVSGHFVRRLVVTTVSRCQPTDLSSEQADWWRPHWVLRRTGRPGAESPMTADTLGRMPDMSWV